MSNGTTFITSFSATPISHGAGWGNTARPLASRCLVEQAALDSLRSFEWVGLTDLFDHSLCLLHYQANGSLPAACDCAHGKLSLGLPRFNHGVSALGFKPATLSRRPSLAAALMEAAAQ